MEKPKVSVVIKTYDDSEDSNRGHDYKQPEGILISYLKQTLDAINRQLLTPLEIVIVDSSQGDGISRNIEKTRNIVGSVPIRRVTLSSDEFSHPKALNLGIRKASGEIIASLSGDATPANDRWLECLVQPFSDPRVAGTFSRQISRPGTPKTALERFRLWWRYRKGDEGERREPIFSNAGSAFRRELALETPFDESLLELEDYQWAINVRTEGFKIIYAGKSEIFHSHLSTNWQTFRRMIYYAFLRYKLLATNWLRLRYRKDSST